jgi:hypothetical protein
MQRYSPSTAKKINRQLPALGGTLFNINSGGHPMPNLRLVYPLILAFLLCASIGHLQAQFFDPSLAGVCPTPSSYGAAFGYFIKSNAYPGTDNHHLANKHCFSEERDLSDEKTMNSNAQASSAKTTCSYHVGSGRLNLQAEVNVTGHRATVPVSGGTMNLNGQGGGNVTIWVKWVDTFTLHSATTKPAPTVKGAVIDPAQVVEIRLKLLNKGHNQCIGGGSEGSVYKTAVLLQAETSDKQVMGGHESDNVDEDCNVEQTNQGTIQVLLGLGKFRIELAASALVSGMAKQEDGYAQTADVKVKLGEYQACYQVVKGPKDLKITSASGTDYACPKK